MKLIPIIIKGKMDTKIRRKPINGFMPDTCAYTGFYKMYETTYFIMHIESGLSYVVVYEEKSAIHICETLEKNLDHLKIIEMGKDGDVKVFDVKENANITKYLNKVRHAVTYKQVKQIKFNN